MFSQRPPPLPRPNVSVNHCDLGSLCLVQQSGIDKEQNWSSVCIGIAEEGGSSAEDILEVDEASYAADEHERHDKARRAQEQREKRSPGISNIEVSNLGSWEDCSNCYTGGNSWGITVRAPALWK